MNTIEMEAVKSGIMAYQPTATLIETTLLEIFHNLKQGYDVPPAALFRSEGIMESALLMQEMTPAEQQTLLEKCWAQAMQEPYPDWVAKPSLEGGVTIPVKMQRAPVYPSTSH